jgi:hypothetical protein
MDSAVAVTKAVDFAQDINESTVLDIYCSTVLAYNELLPNKYIPDAQELFVCCHKLELAAAPFDLTPADYISITNLFVNNPTNICAVSIKPTQVNRFIKLVHGLKVSLNTATEEDAININKLLCKLYSFALVHFFRTNPVGCFQFCNDATSSTALFPAIAMIWEHESPDWQDRKTNLARVDTNNTTRQHLCWLWSVRTLNSLHHLFGEKFFLTNFPIDAVTLITRTHTFLSHAALSDAELNNYTKSVLHTLIAWNIRIHAITPSSGTTYTAHLVPNYINFSSFFDEGACCCCSMCTFEATDLWDTWEYEAWKPEEIPLTLSRYALYLSNSTF